MLELPFTSSDFHEAWADYLEHREEIKKPYKDDKTMNRGLKKLFRLSYGVEEIAIAILEETLTEKWQGFFALKYNDPLIIQYNKKQRDGIPTQSFQTNR